LAKNKQGKRYRWLIGLALAIAIAGGGYFYWQLSDTDDAVPVAREETVTRGDIIASLSEDGTASVTTQTTGLDLDVTLDDDTHLDLTVQVEEILVRAGENVKAGQALFVLDQASLNKAMQTLNNAYQEAQLKADEATLNLTLGTAEAAQTRTESLDSGSTASGVYENTLEEMAQKIQTYKKTIAETQEDYDTASELLELYNVRTATKNNMKSLVDYYEDALEALETFYDDYNEDNADYKASYNSYKNQLTSLKENLEKAESNMASYAGSDDSAKYGDAYDTAVDQFNRAVEIINKYQSVVDEYDTLEDRIADAKDCLEEAQEAYDDYEEDYQDWYGNQSETDLQRKVNQLKLDLESIQLTYDNYKLLYESNRDIAESEKNRSTVSAETADLTYASTVNKLQQQVLSTQLTAQNLYDYVQELNSCLQDNVILSPCDGLVTNIAFAAGDAIDLTKDVVTIAQDDSVSIALSIDQEDIANVALDQQALVTFDTSEQTFEGRVDAISVSPMAAGAPTVNYTVTVKVEGDGLADIYEGMSCTVELVTDRVDDVLLLPKRAITTEGRTSYVQRKQADGTVTRQEVTLGFTDGSSYEIKSGLAEGDVVLIESQVNSDSAIKQREQGESMRDTAAPEGMTPPTGGKGGMPGGTSGNS